uniref:JmjC domain-containing protein n=1 Tax=Elaeophora elaphi TaxID=1147741 RepID=A0A158Q8S9_9BILA
MTELEPSGTKQKGPRKNRRKMCPKKKRSESTSSEEEWFSSDESIHEDKIAEDQEEQQFASGPWTYDLDVVLLKKEFEIKDVCREMNASGTSFTIAIISVDCVVITKIELNFSKSFSDFTVEYVQKNGLEEPLLFRDSLSSLGMKMPKDGTLTVRCVLKAVGDRLVEVVDVMTQGSRQMMLSDFVDYYESPPAERKDLLNLLSLEFSLTSLSKRVRGPTIAQEIDWVELYWPKDLRNSPSTFPKVQNYCLMSVKRSFTDFHIDFGGTSVWYHVYKGRKIFWVIEPTEDNILKYERWIVEGSQHEAFFGDLVDKCARIELYEGYTFIIPSGWIHAVYTPEDSLVFGGNFLHSFSIPMQLRIIRSENILMIKEKYRYPSYMEMVWYVIENIVKKATGRTYRINKTDKKGSRLHLIVPSMSNLSQSVSSSSDQKVDSNALGVKIGANADGIIMHIDNVPENATNNVITTRITADKKKEANEDVTTYEGDTSAGVKADTMDSAVVEVVFLKFSPKTAFWQRQILASEYLATISKKEREGFKLLLVYMREVVKNHRNSAGQEKDDLLNVFEVNVLNHEVSEHFLVKKEKNTEQQISPKLNQWLKAFGKNKSPAAKRKVPSKEKVVEMQQFVRPKPPKSKVKSNKKLDYHKPDGPLIVGGIPPAIMPADAPQAPNPYGYDPLASVTPLGHKQLPSAYRRTPDMAKAPPSQKFRLQPQLRKVIATSEKMEDVPEKASDKSWSTAVTSVPGPSNDNKSVEYEGKTVTITQADVERSFYHNESARSHRDRDKDNQRENRHTVKEEYPELQYRSPLVRPGPSNRGTNVISKLGHNLYRYPNKAFKRRYTDSSSAADYWSIGNRDTRRASDCDSKKSEYPTWRPEAHHISGTFSRSFARPWSEEMSTDVRHNCSVPGDPRLPSAEGLSKWSSAAKVPRTKDYEEGRTLPIIQPTQTSLNISMNISQSVGQKTPSPVGLVGSSQYVPLLNRERNLTPASIPDTDISTQSVPGSDRGIVAVTSSLSLPDKCSVSPSGKISVPYYSFLTISESHGSTVVEPVKSAEIKKPEIRDLSVTLNEDKEDGAEIMTAAEELAELTKVFDADERDPEKERTGSLMVTVEQRKLKRQDWSSLKADDNEEHDSSPAENIEADPVSLPPKSSKIPTETVLQNLSSLTAEFNAVVD